MSTLAVRPVRLSRRRVLRPHRAPSRVMATLRLIRDVFVEARGMAVEAKRHYPYFE